VVFPDSRPRRLRVSAAVRALVAETRLRPQQLVLPMFVREGASDPVPITSMPGVVQHTRDSARKAVADAAERGVGGVMLFGVPEHKDAQGSGATDPDGVLSVAIRDAVAEAGDALVVMSDLCLDEFTDHGHCGVLDERGPRRQRRDAAALCRDGGGARRGRGAPGRAQRNDGRPGRSGAPALDGAGQLDVGILAYAAKYASALYGPFREAVDSSLVGNRMTYQQQPATVGRRCARCARTWPRGPTS
jgi:porphobilinogen synthase